MSKFNPTTAHIPQPNPSLFKLALFFRLGLGIFLLLSVLLTTVGCSTNAATVPWKRATDVVSKPFLERIVRDNTELEPTSAVPLMLAWTAEEKQNSQLVLLNFNNPGGCGQLGCLYTGYLVSKTGQPKQVFNSYLNPNLPPSVPLFTVDDKTSNSELPCLVVMQLESQQLRRLLYCFNDTHYQVATSELLNQQSKD